MEEKKSCNHIFISLQNYDKSISKFIRGYKYKCIDCRILSYSEHQKFCGHKSEFQSYCYEGLEKYHCEKCDIVFTIYLTDNRNDNNSYKKEETSSLLVKDYY